MADDDIAKCFSWLPRATIQSLVQDLPPESNQIASYDHLLDMICDIVRERNVIRANVDEIDGIEEGICVEITFRDVFIESPRMPGMPRGSPREWMTPAEARVMGATYSGSVKVSAEMRVYVTRKIPADKGAERAEGDGMEDEEENAAPAREVERVSVGQVRVVEGATLFKIPMMTRCKACTLTKLGADAGPSAREERGGMLILQGTSHVVQAQKNPLPAVAVLMEGKQKTTRVRGKSETSWMVEIRSPHILKARNTSTMSLSMSRDLPLSIMVNNDYFPKSIPFPLVARLLGFGTLEEIEWLVWPKARDEDYHAAAPDVRLARARFAESLQVPMMSWSVAEICEWLGEENQPSAIERCLRQECLPQMGTDDADVTKLRKALFLGSCCRRLCLTQVDPKRYPLDFRDYEGNQYLQMPHELLSIMVRQLYKDYATSLQFQLFRYIRKNGKGVVRGEALGIEPSELLRRPTLTCKISDLLAKGEVVVTKSSGTSAPVQVVNSVNPPLCQMCHMARSSASVNREGKYTKKREMHPSKICAFDPCVTPEGQDIGFVESMALGAWVTIGSTIEPVEAALWSLPDDLVSPVAQLSKDNRAAELIYVSGRTVAATNSPREAISRIRLLRRQGVLPRHTGVTWRFDGIHVDCTNGMVVFPLFIVSEMRKAVRVANFCKATKTPLWGQLLDEGVMEYVSVQEAFETTVAPTFKDLVEARRRREAGKPAREYTHLVPHPSMMLGLASAFEPFLEHNQGPRTTYAANMLSQVIGFGPITAGVYGPNGSMEKAAYRLWYPQRSMCTTVVEDALNLAPMGQTMMVAVMDDPYNVEDSVVINKSFLDRGGARMTIFKTETVALRSRTEYFGHPDVEEVRLGKKLLARRARGSTESLDSDGMPIIGTWVRQGSLLVGRISAIDTKDPTGGRVTHYHSTSAVYKGNEPAIVDDVAISGKIVKVRLRISRSAQVGDKFTSRYAQKGTVGRVVHEEDLPFVVGGPPGMEGMRPDLVMNPQAFPSRMTIGQLIEAACSLGAMMSGERVDGSAWSDPERAMKVEQWARESTKVTMASGLTGCPLPRQVGFGPVHYGRLKHMVADKCHARADGPTQPLTQQPTEGRSREGGLRIGEMEKGQIVSHGCDEIFREAQTTRSDPTTIFVCEDCGRQCDSRKKTIEQTVRDLEERGAAAGGGGGGGTCNWCGSSRVSAIGSNYVSTLLMQELMVMGMGTRLRLKR